jgi:hypothetical protein
MKLAIIRPCSWQMLPAQHEWALRRLDWCPDLIDMQHWVETPPSGTIAEQREWMSQEALKAGCELIWMLDADMVVYPGVLRDLLELIREGYDLAGALCYRRLPPFTPVIWGERGQLMPFRDFGFGRVVEASATGCACLLFRASVLAQLEPPWFEFHAEEGRVIRGEDTYFTRRATEAGFRLGVWVHPREDVGHLQSFEVDRHMWLLGQILGLLGGWEQVTALYCRLLEEQETRRKDNGNLCGTKRKRESRHNNHSRAHQLGPHGQGRGH